MLLRLAFPVSGEAAGGDMLGEAMKVSERIGTVKGSCVRKQTTCSPILSHALMYWLNQHTLLANAARDVGNRGQCVLCCQLLVWDVCSPCRICMCAWK